MNIDLYSFNLINGLAGRWAWFDYLWMFIAEYSEYILAVIFILLLAINLKKYWKIILLSSAAAGISRFAVGTLIRFSWFRPRPFVAMDVNQLVYHDPLEGSFPSGHALFYFALSYIIYAYNKKLGIAFYVFSLLIVFSRVFVGIHWPSDILAGAIIGTLVAWGIDKVLRKCNIKMI